MITAINNYVTVDLVEKPPTRLLNPDKDQISTQRWGKVLTVGPGHPDLGGCTIPLPLEKDELIYCMAHGIYKVKDVHVVSEFDIMGKAELDTESKEIRSFIPMGNLILVDPEEKQSTTSTGLIIPDKNQDPVVRGKVLELGTGWKHLDGSDIPFHVKKGQTIYFLPDRLMKVRGDLIGMKNDLYLVAHADIVVVEE